jgi:hypothetical protein
METMNEETKPNNPRMQHFDGIYANDAYASTGDHVTLRDEVAKSAMIALLSNNTMVDVLNDYSIEWVVKNGFKIADEFLKQREL